MRRQRSVDILTPIYNSISRAPHSMQDCIYNWIMLDVNTGTNIYKTWNFQHNIRLTKTHSEHVANIIYLFIALDTKTSMPAI